MAFDQANLSDTKALRELAVVVARVPGLIGRIIDDVESDAGTRLRRVVRAAEHAREDLRRAEQAYYAADEEDQNGAKNALDEASDRVVRIERAIERLQGSLRKYKMAARELSDARRGLLAGAAVFLTERLQAVDKYLALQLDSGPAASVSAAIGSSGGNFPSSTSSLVDMENTPLPEGFAWVPIRDIVESDLASSTLEWKKGVSQQQMRIGLSAFRRDMLPALARNGHITRDEFANMDRDLGRTSRGQIEPDSLAHLYDVFFGGEAIAVDRNPGGGLSITNGRHRASTARELGWTHIPARVLGGRPR